MDELGIVGLGKMGAGLPRQALEKGMRVVGASRGGARAIVLMRRGFGGHPYGADVRIARERQEARVGDIFRPPRGRT